MASIEAGRPPSRDERGLLAASATRNIAHALAVVLALAVVAGLAGWLIEGKVIAIAMAALAVVYAAGLAGLPPSMLMQLYGARAVPAAQAGRIASLIDEIAAERAGLRQAPRLYVLPSLEITSFALGHGARAAIALSEGLLRRLTLRETAGMIAHEIAHIRSGDTLFFALGDAATRVAQLLGLAGTVLVVANGVGYLIDDLYVPWSAALALVAAPAVMNVLQLALPHAREHDADAEAARLTGDVMGLAGAVRRLPHARGTLIEDFTPPAFARRIPAPSLSRLHPHPEARIERLFAQAGGSESPQPALVVAEEPMLLHVGFGPAEMRPRFRWPGVWW